MNWSEWIINNDLTVRLSFFFGVLAAMAVWEVRRPRRRLSQPKALRWINNLGLVAFNSFVVYLLFPATAVGVAIFVQQQQWGLLNLYAVPFPLAVVIAVITLDFVIYLQHVMVHAIPALWRLHRVHHADLDYDVTTGSRFHTFEIILSMLIKFAAIALLGPPVVAVVLFEVLLNATAMFNHSNVHLPEKIDRVLRLLVVTPDMHRVHHSVHAPLTNSNFGFNLPWWDRLFGTYVAQPPEGHVDMEIGLDGEALRDPKRVERIPGMLMLPFLPYLGEYTINRRW